MAQEPSILVVEDSPTQSMYLKFLLEENGYHVHVARDGREGLNAASAKRPQLIISDVMMPGMTGYEMCEAIKDNPLLSPIPLILLTTLSDPKDILKGIEAKADYYLTKPFDETALLSRVKDILDHPVEPKKDEKWEEHQIVVGGERRKVLSTSTRIMNLLLSTYENAVQRNTELLRTQEELRELNEKLEERVEERTMALKESQAQLIQVEKLGALGILTAGIAHELNNPMMGMLNFAQYCKKHVDSETKVYSVLDDMERETRRCIDIVKNLQTFSRMKPSEEETRERIACEEIIERVRKLLSYRIEKDGVTFNVTTSPGCPDVSVNAGNIQQIFLNLIGNALDAMQDTKTRSIDVHIDQDPHGFVRVRVKDTGSGMPKDIQEKIFDPFYTTKPVGKGTGLGLFVSRGMIEKHGGAIECGSEAGKGSVFTVRLPV